MVSLVLKPMIPNLDLRSNLIAVSTFTRNVVFFFLLKYSWLTMLWNCSTIVAVNFCCTAKWFSYTYIYILFHILSSQDGLSQDIEYSSLCYTAGPCCLSILYIVICICSSQIPNSSLPNSPSLLATTSLFSMSVSLFLFHKYVHLCHILDSTYKWYHIFVFLFLAYFA